MPAHPAITIHSHRSLGATPVPLQAETYLLMQRARISANPGDTQRFIDLAGDCFLRVDSDQRLSWDINFFTLDFLGLANYFPGRNLADQALTFANGGAIPFQFNDDGIFIYDTVTADDPMGELRAGNVKIDYDMHTGLDSEAFPVSGPAATFTDIPSQTAVEVVDDMKVMLLKDIFQTMGNIAGDFTATPYNGDPAGAGVPIDSAVVLGQWATLSQGSLSYSTQNRNDEILWGTDVSARTCTHIRFERGGNVVADVALAVSLTVAPDTYLRAPAGVLGLQLTYPSDTLAFAETDDDTTNPSRHFIQYICGGDRDTFIPSSKIDVYFYVADTVPYVDTFQVDSGAGTFDVGVSMTGVTAVAATDIITSTAHGLVAGNRVLFVSGTGFGNLTPGHHYYAIVTGPDTFSVSATRDSSGNPGTPVNITSDGSAGEFQRVNAVIPVSGQFVGTNFPDDSWTTVLVVMKINGLPVWIMNELATVNAYAADNPSNPGYPSGPPTPLQLDRNPVLDLDQVPN